MPEPKTIAIIGASSGEALSSRLESNLGAHGYEGEIFLVNPRHSEIDGMLCYPIIGAVPAAVYAAALSATGWTSGLDGAHARTLGRWWPSWPGSRAGPSGTATVSSSSTSIRCWSPSLVS